MSETEIMESLGYNKIYNCGNAVYIKILKQEEKVIDK